MNYTTYKSLERFTMQNKNILRIVTNIAKTQLFRNIFIGCLAIAVIFPMISVFFIYPSFTKLLTETIEEDAISIATHLAKTINPEKKEFTEDLFLKDSVKIIQTYKKDFQLEKLKIFNKSGTIVYSTDSKDIGVINKRKYFHEIVAKGRPYTKLVRKDAKSLENRQVKADVVETYVPLISNYKFNGAVEIYYDITAKKEKLDTLIFHFTIVLFAISSSLMVAFILILYKASKINIERDRTQEALRKSEQRFSLFMDHFPGVAFIKDINGRMIYGNKAFQERMGHDNFYGKTNDQLWSSEAAAIFNEADQRVLSKDRGMEFVEQFPYPDGQIHTQVTNRFPIYDEGEPAYLGGIGLDITNLKQTEDALRESKENLDKAQEIAHVGSWSRDLKTDQGQWSDEMYRILGFTPGNPEHPTHEDFLSRVHPNDREYVDSELKKGVEKKRSFDLEFRTVPIEGSERIIHSRGTVAFDQAGVSVRRFGINQDITETRRLQAQLHQSQKMEAIGTLAGGVAHDLNNVLGGLVGFPELLLLQLPEDSPLRKPILTIQNSGEKAAAIVQDLLTLARRGVATSEVFSLNDIISEYLKSPEYENLQSHHPGVYLETCLEKGVLNILGSSIHLSKTLMNLISNAAEAMPEGGKLTVSTENRYIERPIRGYDDIKEGDYVVLTISDTGTGISPDDIEKIFEPFYTKKKMGRSGTGLGMAVVWGTVKDHNGYIDVQSTEGKGTTFALYFPVTRKKLSEDESSLTIESYSGNGESILIVDDVEEQRNIASGMLKELGYSAVSVSSGEEAVIYLKANKVDLLVLDMIMDPGMDGLDTYKKILAIHPGQKAIIASGFSGTDRVKEVQRLGAGTYIRKPLLLEKIGLAVKKELEK